MLGGGNCVNRINRWPVIRRPHSVVRPRLVAQRSQEFVDGRRRLGSGHTPQKDSNADCSAALTSQSSSPTPTTTPTRNAGISQYALILGEPQTAGDVRRYKALAALLLGRTPGAGERSWQCLERRSRAVALASLHRAIPECRADEMLGFPMRATRTDWVTPLVTTVRAAILFRAETL